VLRNASWRHRRPEFCWMRASSSSAPRAHAAETGCEQRIALRDHIVEGHPTIGSEYVGFCGESAATGLLRAGAACRLLPFCHRHVRFDRVCNETILMCSVMHLIEFFYTGSSVAAPCDLRAKLNSSDRQLAVSVFLHMPDCLVLVRI